MKRLSLGAARRDVLTPRRWVAPRIRQVEQHGDQWNRANAQPRKRVRPIPGHPQLPEIVALGSGDSITRVQVIIKASRQRRSDSRHLGEVRHPGAHHPLQAAEVLQKRAPLGGPQSRHDFQNRLVITARALAAIETGMLKNGLEALAPGGRLVYATCSLEPEENDQVVEGALAEKQGPRLLSRNELTREFPYLSPLFDPCGYFRTRPDLHSMDGFFAAVMVRDA